MAQTTALKDVTSLVQDELEGVAAIVTEALAPDQPELQSLLAHVGCYRGKQLRPALAILTGRALGKPGDVLLRVAAIIEMIHVATLVHDDILDGAAVRRKLPSLNAIHGSEVSVLVGDYIYAKAFHMSVSLPDQRCSRRLADVTRVICQGEITQMLHRYDLELSEELYLRIIAEKTAILYGAAGELGALYVGASDADATRMREFGESLGNAFQIIDDCLDVEGEEAVVGKSLGTDFGKGKLTLPFLHLCRGLDAEGHRRFAAIFNDAELENRQEILRSEFDLKAGLDYAHAKADEYLKAALRALQTLPQNEYTEAMRSMADFVLHRRN